MKKIISIITILLLIIVIGIFGYSIYLNTNSQIKITELKREIKEQQQLVEDTKTSRDNLEKEINELNEKLKEKVSEYDLWLKLKEKITK